MFSRLPPIQSRLKKKGTSRSRNEHIPIDTHPSDGGFVITVDGVNDYGII